MADDQAAFLAEDGLPGLERDEAGEALFIDGLVALFAHGEEAGVVRGCQRADEREREAVEQLVVAV